MARSATKLTLGGPGRVAALIGSAGVIIFSIGLAAAFLPLMELTDLPVVVGGMLVLAGSVEALAGATRLSNKAAFVLPGVITIAAGAFFVVEPFDSFVPMVRLVSGWLLLRGVFLLFGSLRVGRSVWRWTLVSGVTDVSLGGILLAELSAWVFPIALFGPTSDIVRGFAIVLALSFVTTAMLLIDVATCEGKADL